MSIDYLESLFTGMDIIIDKRLKDLSFDKLQRYKQKEEN